MLVAKLRADRWCGAALWIVSALVCAGPASSARIEYTAHDVADSRPGEDRWLYEYVVSGFAFAAHQGFTIYFDVDSMRSLEIPAGAVGADWDVLAVQPDPDLPDDGFFDALALVPDASLDVAFRVSLVWSGGPGIAPGPQRFEINQFDDQGGYVDTLDAGLTAIPEPGVALLLGAGLVALAGRRGKVEALASGAVHSRSTIALARVGAATGRRSAR